jgi:hypothetical protein
MSFREEGDWEPGPDMESDYCCAGCARGHGCERDTQGEADQGPTQGPYNATKAPPAFLNPRSILRNRRRTDHYLATGEFTWPRPTLPNHSIERTSHVSHP